MQHIYPPRLASHSIRFGKRVLHLGISRAHARTDIIALIHNADVSVITLDGTVLGDYTLNPTTGYQPQRKNG